MRLLKEKAETVQELIEMLQALPEDVKNYTFDYEVGTDSKKGILIKDADRQVVLGSFDAITEELEYLDTQNEVDDTKVSYIEVSYIKNSEVCMPEYLRSLLSCGWFITDAEIKEVLLWSGDEDITVDSIRDSKNLKGA